MNIGEKWGEWTIESLIGEGAFGKVYKVVRNEFGHTYESALKVIRIPQSSAEVTAALNEGMDEDSVRHYFRGMVDDIVEEFTVMSELRGHSNIVSYEDHSVVELEDNLGWEIYIRMEYLTPLYKYLKTHSLSVSDAIEMSIDMCKALELCQRFNLIHRDIKPDNIFVSNIGTYKLGDFGVARQLEKTVSALSKKGTYTYMAPEVYKGLPYDATVDIYSLGIVLYRFLNNNRTPFLPPYPQQVTYADREKANAIRMTGQPIEPPCNADGMLSDIVLKACAYDPKDRFQNPTDMRKALETVLHDKTEGGSAMFTATDLSQMIEGSMTASHAHSAVADDQTRSIFGMSQSVSKSKSAGTYSRAQQQAGAAGTAGAAGAAGSGASARSFIPEPSVNSSDASMSNYEYAEKSLSAGRASDTAIPAGFASFDSHEKSRRVPVGEYSRKTYPQRTFTPEPSDFQEATDDFPTVPLIPQDSMDDEIDWEETIGDPSLMNRGDETIADPALAGGSAVLSEDHAEETAILDKDALGTGGKKPEKKGKKKKDKKAEGAKDKGKDKASDKNSGNKNKKPLIIAACAVALAAVLLVVGIQMNKREVPDVVGLTSAEAQDLIEEAELVYIEETEFAEDTDQDDVISQNVEAGSRIKKGESVIVTVSLGAPIPAPDLAGMSFKDAEKKATELGLNLEVTGEEFSDTIGKDNIISQDVEPGADCYNGQTISVVKSKGITQVEVPDVIGKGTDDAKAELEKAGFGVEVNSVYSSSPVGTIVEQSVEGGKTADKGSTITISSSQGPQPVKRSSGSSGKKKSKKKKSGGGGGSSWSEGTW